MKLNSPKQRTNTKKQSSSGFILQYKKLRILELYYIFFTEFCDVNKLEELEMDTDSLNLVLAEKELEDCIRPERKTEWERLRSEHCSNSFTADEVAYFFPRRRCNKRKKHDNRDTGLFKSNSDAQRCYVYVAKLTVAMILPQKKQSSVVDV